MCKLWSGSIYIPISHGSIYFFGLKIPNCVKLCSVTSMILYDLLVQVWEPRCWRSTFVYNKPRKVSVLYRAGFSLRHFFTSLHSGSFLFSKVRHIIRKLSPPLSKAYSIKEVNSSICDPVLEMEFWQRNRHPPVIRSCSQSRALARALELIPDGIGQYGIMYGNFRLLAFIL